MKKMFTNNKADSWFNKKKPSRDKPKIRLPKVVKEASSVPETSKSKSNRKQAEVLESVLCSISEEERQRRLENRIAAIIGSQGEPNQLFEEFSEERENLQPKIPRNLKYFQNESCTLWNLSSSDGKVCEEDYTTKLLSDMKYGEKVVAEAKDLESYSEPPRISINPSKKPKLELNTNDKCIQTRTPKSSDVGIQTDEDFVAGNKTFIAIFEESHSKRNEGVEGNDEENQGPSVHWLSIDEAQLAQMLEEEFIPDQPVDVMTTPKSSTPQTGVRLKLTPTYFSPILAQNKTPMLNYSTVETPILKNELRRFGLKPLPRSKAKVLLRHIYEETHK